MAKTPVFRQRLRRWLLIISLVLFPVTISYFSPYIIIDASSQGIVNGSLMVFGLLAVFALFLGRAWCGWLCPAGSIGDRWCAVNNRRTRGGAFDAFKWAIWIPWVGLIAFLAVRAGGYHTLNLTYLTEHGVSVANLQMFVMFCGVVAVISILSLTTGRRGFCHYACWIAPFMIVGERLRRILRLPGLRLRASSEECIHCELCTTGCPMSLNVHGMLQNARMESSECILCGNCVDTCPKHVISYAWRSQTRGNT